MCNTDLLARRSNVYPALPIQPMRTRLRRAVRPTLSTVELGDEHQEAMVRCVEVTCELGDFIFELRHRAGGFDAFVVGQVAFGVARRFDAHGFHGANPVAG